jgi:hypothetical protein
MRVEQGGGDVDVRLGLFVVAGDGVGPCQPVRQVLRSVEALGKIPQVARQVQRLSKSYPATSAAESGWYTSRARLESLCKETSCDVVCRMVETRSPVGIISEAVNDAQRVAVTESMGERRLEGMEDSPINAFAVRGRVGEP